MGLVAECNHPGCTNRTPASWLPSGRLVVEGWFVLPATHLRPLELACCAEHVRGVKSHVRGQVDMALRAISEWEAPVYGELKPGARDT